MGRRRSDNNKIPLGGVIGIAVAAGLLIIVIIIAIYLICCRARKKEKEEVEEAKSPKSPKSKPHIYEELNTQAVCLESNEEPVEEEEGNYAQVEFKQSVKFKSAEVGQESAVYSKISDFKQEEAKEPLYANL